MLNLSVSDLIRRDDEYTLIPKIARTGSRGVQCGECGMKFDNDKAYGFHCGNMNCPVQPKFT